MQCGVIAFLFKRAVVFFSLLFLHSHQKNRQIVDGNFSVYVFKKKIRQLTHVQFKSFFYLENVYLLFRTIKCDGN